MHVPPLHRLRRHLRLALIWLIAVVLPLQGLAVTAAATRGPLHTHSVSTSAPAPLIDFRRAFAAPTAGPSAPLEAWQHLVGHLGSERHHHAASDASVSRSPDDPSAAQNDEAGTSSMPFVAILPSPADWRLKTVGHAPLASPGWTATTRDTAPPKRPPREG